MASESIEHLKSEAAAAQPRTVPPPVPPLAVTDAVLELRVVTSDSGLNISERRCPLARGSVPGSVESWAAPRRGPGGTVTAAGQDMI